MVRFCPAKQNNHNVRRTQSKSKGFNRSVSAQSSTKKAEKKGRNSSDPSTQLYFSIRKTCSTSDDDVAALRKAMPSKECKGLSAAQTERLHAEVLHGLVKQGCIECVRYLLCELKLNVNTIRQKDGCVPLHTCFYNLQGDKLARMADLLVQLGADKTAKNKWGEPPCMFEFKKSSVPAKGGFPSAAAMKTGGAISVLSPGASKFSPSRVMIQVQ
jgi:hypothetical protein